MLRWTIPFLIVIAAIEPAVSADESLPAGLRRPHYKFRTTIAREAPHVARRYARPPYADETRQLLFTLTDGSFPYIPPVARAPLLPGSSTLPGYYGSSHSYEYQGPYYGGQTLGYRDRLPYACGVYGYC